MDDVPGISRFEEQAHAQIAASGCGSLEQAGVLAADARRLCGVWRMTIAAEVQVAMRVIWREKQARWRAANRERANLYQAAYRARNRERLNEEKRLARSSHARPNA